MRSMGEPVGFFRSFERERERERERGREREREREEVEVEEVERRERKRRERSRRLAARAIESIESPGVPPAGTLHRFRRLAQGVDHVELEAARARARAQQPSSERGDNAQRGRERARNCSPSALSSLLDRRPRTPADALDQKAESEGPLVCTDSLSLFLRFGFRKSRARRRSSEHCASDELEMATDEKKPKVRL